MTNNYLENLLELLLENNETRAKDVVNLLDMILQRTTDKGNTDNLLEIQIELQNKIIENMKKPINIKLDII